ncbi:hypothetical protein B0F90DRAFT_1718916 [Multifurca ochricompacta]|uniref:Uncharacterized protein n=1 Tax=Multifurca ochricompacta TaxID=376703 RepID=A0AAD4QNY4_9AGAM|nr:hypothetical protein B0F90DRAFT_1718916 [Multifurca ochricompacta]
MHPGTQPPIPSSPGKESVESIGIHSHSPPSPIARCSHPAVSGSDESRTRSVAAILRDASRSFDQKSCVITPFDNEVERDAEFYQNFKDKQLEVIALMNSWVFSRLISENERAGESLAHEMDAMAETEREQGRSFLPHLLLSCLPERMRVQLESCVSNIKAALATLSRAVM